jgi:hypothetical protein
MSGSDATFFDSKLSKLAEARERALAQPAGPEQRKIPDDPYYELGVQDATIKGLRRQLAEIEAVVDQQANDEGLWCEAGTCAESYIQQALRRLHAAIERKSPDDCAIAALKQKGRE